LIEQTRAVHLIAVRFKPGGLYPFVRFPISEATNQTIDLDLIFGNRLKELEGQLFETRATKKKIALPASTFAIINEAYANQPMPKRCHQADS
jgi:hypothetical protein